MAKRKKNNETNQGNQSGSVKPAEKAAKKNPWTRGADKNGVSVDANAKTLRGNSGKDKDTGVNARLSREEAKRDYLFSMDNAPRLDDSRGAPWLLFIPSVIFTALVIVFVQQYGYARDMSVFYFSAESKPPEAGVNNLVDFFSHLKVDVLGWTILIIGIMIVYQLVAKTFVIKRSVLYIPMIGYLLFVLLSFAFSEYKDVAWNGWNDRFEGTAMILCYYLAVFFIMNTVHSERNIKFIVYPVAAVSVALSIIGLTQLTGHDFFRSVIGQKLIVPNLMTKSGSTTWALIDQAAAQGKEHLKFTFENNEIYQTVYNINYVSFYLTLLIPLFAMMFVWSKGLARKLTWGAIISLVVINFLGAKSSGGMLGMLVVIILVIVVLNKRLIEWKRSLFVILAIVVAVGAVNVGTAKVFGGFSWLDEVQDSMNKTFATKDDIAKPASVPGAGTSGAQGESQGTSADQAGALTQTAEQRAQTPATLDYLVTKDNTFTFSLDGNVATVALSPSYEATVTDEKGATVGIQKNETTGETTFLDDRFAGAYLMPAVDQAGNNFISFNLYGADRGWMFILTGENNSELMYRNDLGKNVSLENIEHFGFENNPGFGSGRGYIWSASLPMIKDTIFVGHGADTYCIYFPHKDYVGKYNAGWNINMIVDKPHNMYIATAINTGLLSLIFLLALFFMYVWQSIRLYRRSKFTSFADFAGAGIFFGTSGFMVSAFVDDSSVSVMPMFYGLLATGIAINIMIKRRAAEAGETESFDGKEAD